MSYNFDYTKELSHNFLLIKNLYWFKKNRFYHNSGNENFGDYLSTVVVSEVARRKKMLRMNFLGKKLFAIGSILHYTKNNDVIWGSGVNGKMPLNRYTFSQLDVRAVRGPISKKFLEDRDIYVPEIFGDPALLIPTLYPEISYKPKPGKILVIPNLNEIEEIYKKTPKNLKILSPFNHWRHIIEEIVTSELVITSSLHCLIISESFGVPVKLFKPVGGETLTKYYDYFLGTGRKISKEIKPFEDTLQEDDIYSYGKLIFNESKLLDAFPDDLYKR